MSDFILLFGGAFIIALFALYFIYYIYDPIKYQMPKTKENRKDQKIKIMPNSQKDPINDLSDAVKNSMNIYPDCPCPDDIVQPDFACTGTERDMLISYYLCDSGTTKSDCGCRGKDAYV